ncbi:MAG TPA: RluA family pseudouridine synthase [Clostridia bacterium]|nr:RluA family pseudouridine synthase [Clostridia bacterium]
MKSFVINENDSGQRLDKYLLKSLPALPKGLLYKYVRIKRIKVNGKRAEISAKLNNGDVVDMYINDEFFENNEENLDFLEASNEINIIYEDDNVLIIDKGVGLLSHPDKGEYIDTLITRVKRYLYEQGCYNPKEENTFSPALANRIDRNTRGLVIAAKNAKALRILNEKIKVRQIHKFYLCIVDGNPSKGTKSSDNWILLDGWIKKDENKNTVYVNNKSFDGAKPIETKYKVIATKSNLSLVEVDLLTGRAHQIRAHMASIGNPLLGDNKYGHKHENKRLGYNKQFLCSYRLEFDFTDDADILNYLNGKSFEIKNIEFVNDFYNGNLGSKSV